MNPRRPTPSGPKPDPFDLARAPPPIIISSWLVNKNLRITSSTHYVGSDHKLRTMPRTDRESRLSNVSIAVTAETNSGLHPCF